MFRGRLLAFSFLSVFVFVCAVDNGNSQGNNKRVKTVSLAQTGQVTSYAQGDDGDLQMGVPSPTPRFSDNGDGTVTDRLTKLTWTKDAGQYQPNDTYWYTALNACNSYSVGTLDDWRLPNT